MARSLQKPLVLTLGDPKGIGPEITAKAWLTLRRHKDFAFAVVAPADILNAELDSLDAPPAKCIDNCAQAIDIFAEHLPIIPFSGANRADMVIASISQSVELTLSQQASGVVTNPISKDILYQAGFKHPGHTEYLGALTENIAAPYERGPLMMLSGGGLRAALVTVHMPLKEAAKAITKEQIIHTAKVLDGGLRHDFGISNPRIALAGLNPHAGEGGALGHEEIEIINPAAQELRRMGLGVTDAQSADTLFHAEAREGYDAVLAMYHDQGLIPVKTLDFHGGVNITLGLPIVRTSPDHGTAFNIAGQGIARADSLIAAIKAAREIAGNRTVVKYG